MAGVTDMADVAGAPEASAAPATPARRNRGGAAAQALPEVSVSDDGAVRHLHLGSPWVQGAMRIAAPFALELEYVQRMMAWLLFADAAQVSCGHAMQLGLGAGSITKFCHQRLRMRSTAVELNPQVLAVCRQCFRLPPDGARLQVVLADAAQEIRRPQWRAAVHALAVDLYDHEAAAPVLDSPDFYADCRALLAPGGCMAVNLFGRSARFERSRESISQAFGARALWAFKPTREGNLVLLAQAQATRPGRAELLARAQAVQARWALPGAKWLRLLRPVVP